MESPQRVVHVMPIKSNGLCTFCSFQERQSVVIALLNPVAQDDSGSLGITRKPIRRFHKPELAVNAAQLDDLAQTMDVREHIINNLSDNAVTVACQ
jgi:exopolysaccharide biosynthesis protein